MKNPGDGVTRRRSHRRRHRRRGGSRRSRAGQRRFVRRASSRLLAPASRLPAARRRPVALHGRAWGRRPISEPLAAAYLRAVAHVPATPPKALLVVSAHWEEPVPTVMTSAAPPMLYDYYGFPPEAYRITWPAPGHPEVAVARKPALLGAAGIESGANAERGFDHGTFVPLKLAYPEADVPTVQLSLKQGLDPEEHLAMGRALAPLRDEGVFIVGSGMSRSTTCAASWKRAGAPGVGGFRRLAARDGGAGPAGERQSKAHRVGERALRARRHTRAKSTCLPLNGRGWRGRRGSMAT